MASSQQSKDEGMKVGESPQDGGKQQQNGAPETDIDSGVDENTQQGDGSPKTGSGGTTASRIPRKTPPDSPVKNRSRRPKPAGTPNFPRSKSVPKPFTGIFSIPPSTAESVTVKKVPMNKIVVGVTASPNLKQVRSKIGSLENASYKPGGGEVKIESRKLEWKTNARTTNFNDGYVPKGGDKKIESRKLEWNATSRIGSLENASHKPGGGDKSIQVQKLDWKANSKVGSTDNIKHKPGGGRVKIIEHKIELKVESKVGSLANIKHKPGGGDKKVFNDVEYLRQTSSTLQSSNVSRTSSRRESATQLISPMESLILPSKSPLQQQQLSEPDKSTPAQPTYQYQMKRRMSPMSSGF